MTRLQRGEQGRPVSLSFLRMMLVSESLAAFSSEGQRSSSRLPDWVFVRVLTMFKISRSMTDRG